MKEFKFYSVYEYVRNTRESDNDFHADHTQRFHVTCAWLRNKLIRSISPTAFFMKMSTIIDTLPTSFTWQVHVRKIYVFVLLRLSQSFYKIRDAETDDTDQSSRWGRTRASNSKTSFDVLRTACPFLEETTKNLRESSPNAEVRSLLPFTYLHWHVKFYALSSETAYLDATSAKKNDSSHVTALHSKAFDNMHQNEHHKGQISDSS